MVEDLEEDIEVAGWVRKKLLLPIFLRPEWEGCFLSRKMVYRSKSR